MTKKILLQEIKLLCSSFSYINELNFLEKECELHALVEKYILLKNSSLLKDEPISEANNSEQKETNFIPENTNKEKHIIYTIENDEEVEEPKPIIENNVEKSTANSITIGTENSQIPVVPTVESTQFVQETNHAKTNVKKLSLDFNDRIGFINVLFDGKTEEFDLILNTLNMVHNHNETITLITNLKERFQWFGDKEEFANRLEELNHKRFE